LIESKFYRLSAHGNAITVPPVPTQFPKHEAVEVYGRKAEYEAAKANDPIPKFRSKLIAAGVMVEADANGIEEKFVRKWKKQCGLLWPARSRRRKMRSNTFTRRRNEPWPRK